MKPCNTTLITPDKIPPSWSWRTKQGKKGYVNVKMCDMNFTHMTQCIVWLHKNASLVDATAFVNSSRLLFSCVARFNESTGDYRFNLNDRRERMVAWDFVNDFGLDEQCINFMEKMFYYPYELFSPLHPRCPWRRIVHD